MKELVEDKNGIRLFDYINSIDYDILMRDPEERKTPSKTIQLQVL